jgi:hypothetical protein
VVGIDQHTPLRGGEGTILNLPHNLKQLLTVKVCPINVGLIQHGLKVWFDVLPPKKSVVRRAPVFPALFAFSDQLGKVLPQSNFPTDALR